MPPTRFEASHIKNKHKREEVVQKVRKAKTQAKLQNRLAIAKAEANDPEAKKVRTSTTVTSWTKDLTAIAL
jgi:ribosome production factor 1